MDLPPSPSFETSDDDDVETEQVRTRLMEFEQEKKQLQRSITLDKNLAAHGLERTSTVPDGFSPPILHNPNDKEPPTWASFEFGMNNLTNPTSLLPSPATTTTTTAPPPSSTDTIPEPPFKKKPVKSLVPPGFTRVILQESPTAMLASESRQDMQEKMTACEKLLAALQLRRKYHIPCKGYMYYGSYDVPAYQEHHSENERTHTMNWGQDFKGRAPATFAVSYPGQPSPLVKPSSSPPDGLYRVSVQDGVYIVEKKHSNDASSPQWHLLDPALPSMKEFLTDLHELDRTVNSPAVKSLCFTRLQLLEARFNLHRIINSKLESLEQRRVPHRDFYNVRKVDVHIHHSAVMTQKHLLRFMKQKLKRCSDEIVMERHDKLWTLKQVFESLGLSAYDLSIDYLDMHADDTMHRFDRFNLKYNPVGESRLREVFLKPSNLIQGRYLAEITSQVFRDLEENKYVLIEPRISVYGKNKQEWDVLGKWYCTNKLASPNVRWMVQVPRLFYTFRQANVTATFQDLLDNVFQPLFDCTLHPDMHPELDCFLNQVVGLDCVDDESLMESFNPDMLLIPPNKWTFEKDPPYVYWMYYLWSNLRVLNALRLELGRTTISFRPHSGETGELLHLSSTFLVAESVNHGIMLRKSPSLQYLYYLAQIGLAVSPLSNNRLFLDYHSNPFPIFFARGLNVALSTDDPLLLHVTKDPLVEEYSVASQVWKLSSTDVCEIARNSVLMSGLEHPFKAHFIGQDFHLPGVAGNDISCTNVPDVRVQFRFETLEGEFAFVKHTAGSVLVGDEDRL